jgi:hypothetical protein
MKHAYHSGLKDELILSTNLNYYKHKSNVVFIHDIDNGLPKEYNICDVLYCDPPWLSGYEKFMNRAGKKEISYKKYIYSLSKIIENNTKPLWLIIGKYTTKRLPKYHRIHKIKLHNQESSLLGWNDSNNYSFKNNFDFLNELAKIYNCIGDFNCGYGNSGRIFKENGKNFVMSDINGKCVFYIAKTLMDY